MLMWKTANAAVAFLDVIPSRPGTKEKGRRELGPGQNPFDIVVRRCGQEVQAYLTCGEGSSCAVLVVAKSAPSIHQAMVDLMLDVGDLATKVVVPTKDSGLWASKPGQGKTL